MFTYNDTPKVRLYSVLVNLGIVKRASNSKMRSNWSRCWITPLRHQTITQTISATWAISDKFQWKFNPFLWRHNRRDGVSNLQPDECLLNRSFRRRSKKTSKLRVTGLCAGNSPEPVNFTTQNKLFPFDDVIMHTTMTFLHVSMLAIFVWPQLANRTESTSVRSTIDRYRTIVVRHRPVAFGADVFLN